MVSKEKVVQCLPNFSEGRDLDKIEKIVNAFRRKEGVKLIDYNNDVNLNRTIVILMGEPQKIKNAVLEAMGIAIEIIDMREHKGQHPRIGAVDVIPFIPLKNMSMLEAVNLSKELAKEAGERFKIPIYLYEKSATRPERESLVNIRRGQYEGMAKKMNRPEWKPDFGPDELNITAGATVVGARMPYIFFNINLDTKNIAVADKIAKNIRFSNGGLRFCKAIGVKIYDNELVQVSIDITDYNTMSLYTVFEMVKMESRRFGVNVISSEIVGLVPMSALLHSALYYLQVDKFSSEQILENTFME
ncbi:glutamate formiminotransferase [Clostridium tetanomorphum]|uniref:glutamate formimidoyltransferase n=1 Tax=Clostridium tetanomorphum TaxID=1553 RepID=A0A923J214_CLOTT|nr:glutamate formimidoyltransferase [Clostridium tetanomorphum]KAJ48859.1 glutamate formiminotransferase [Clostridium tetanomorphum DSM 665]KAJ50471.1 glutamate formiminotransferase [Clostridium tetanomorphum DSM 665]MBC2398260.1 glutamate formimidoyltransferase [Clostridium tetanomorphum]MBP1865621.1 glutamate formiminotransferase [Clostridium tetanomorphum]NRS85873.1 glutamate formiminotransferase [Clostridium tetanomorphum]